MKLLKLLFVTFFICQKLTQMESVFVRLGTRRRRAAWVESVVKVKLEDTALWVSQ